MAVSNQYILGLELASATSVLVKIWSNTGETAAKICFPTGPAAAAEVPASRRVHGNQGRLTIGQICEFDQR